MGWGWLFTCWVLMVLRRSGLRPPPCHSRRDQDEGQEGPWCSQPAPPGYAHQERWEGRYGKFQLSLIELSFFLSFISSLLFRRGLHSSQKEPWCVKRRWRWTHPNANWYVWCLISVIRSRSEGFSIIVFFMLKERDLEMELGDDYILDLQSKKCVRLSICCRK